MWQWEISWRGGNIFSGKFWTSWWWGIIYTITQSIDLGHQHCCQSARTWSVAKLTSLVPNPSWLFLENRCKVKLLFIIQNSSKDILNQLHRSKGFSRFFLIVILILSLQILTRYQCTKCSSQCTIYWQGAFTAQGSVFMFLVFSRR